MVFDIVDGAEQGVPDAVVQGDKICLVSRVLANIHRVQLRRLGRRLDVHISWI